MNNIKFLSAISVLVLLGGCIKKLSPKEAAKSRYDKCNSAISKNHQQAFDLIQKDYLTESQKCKELIKLVPKVVSTLPKFGYFDFCAPRNAGADRYAYPYNFYACRLEQDLKICNKEMKKIKTCSDVAEVVKSFETLKENLSNILAVVRSSVKYREEIHAIKMLEVLEKPVEHNIYIYNE